MSHELETNGTQTAFVSAREDAWHRLGTVLDHTFTAEEAMTFAMLGGWNVHKVPVTASEITDDGVTALEVPGKYATVRTSPFTGQPEALGIVGEWYTPIQNEENCDILDAIVDEGGAHFETAGSLRGGRQTFITMKLPQTMMVGGFDQLDVYIAALNSHDGSAAFRLIVTPVRIVCANTQAAAIKGAKSSFTVRHTTGVQGKIAQARQALGLTFRYIEGFQEEADKMIDQALTDAEFMDIMRQVWPVDVQNMTGQQKRREATLEELFTDADTNSQIRGTRWAGYQAVTEYVDHYFPVSSKLADPESARAERVLVAPTVDLVKQQAFDLLAVA